MSNGKPGAREQYADSLRYSACRLPTHEEWAASYDAEVERLGKEITRITRGDVSPVITTLGDALTYIAIQASEIEELKEEARLHQRHAPALLGERDALRAEIARLKAIGNQCENECDLLRRDAERYRYLRTGNEHVSVEIEDDNEDGWTGVFYSCGGEFLDVRIDEVTETGTAETALANKQAQP